MGTPRVRALSLLLAAAALLSFRSASASQANAFALRLELTEGGSYLTNGGTAIVSVTATTGVTAADDTDSPWDNDSDGQPMLWACIDMTSSGKHDHGCGEIDSSKVVRDAQLTKATAVVSVPSDCKCSKKLSASIQINAASSPLQPMFDLTDVVFQPPFPAAPKSLRFSGPMVGRERNGRVSGTVTSELIGGGPQTLVEYSGPPVGQSRALLFDGVINGFYVSQ